jgi:hypothetical protein
VKNDLNIYCKFVLPGSRASPHNRTATEECCVTQKNLSSSYVSQYTIMEYTATSATTGETLTRCHHPNIDAESSE